MKKILFLSSVIIIGLVSAGMLLSGCNIFDFAHDKEEDPVTIAQKLLNERRYSDAIDELEYAMGDSTDSMIFYLHAKAVLLESGLSIGQMIDDLSDVENQSGKSLPLFSPSPGLSIEDDIETKDKLYQANRIVRKDLLHIINGEATGLIDSTDVLLDFAMSTTISGILGLRDTNQDGEIDEADIVLNISFVDTLQGLDSNEAFQIFGGIDPENPEVSLAGLTAFLPSLPTAKTTRAVLTPNDLNNLLSYILTLLLDSNDTIMIFIEKLIESELDTDELKTYIREAVRMANFYWYNDNHDNDRDGRIDEEIINGLDDDGDGLIDEDSGWYEDWGEKYGIPDEGKFHINPSLLNKLNRFLQQSQS